MNEKTEMPTTTKGSEFSPAFLRILITMTIAVLLIIFGPNLFNLNLRSTHTTVFAPGYLVAAAITVEYAIDEFNGLEPKPNPERTKFLLPTILVLNLSSSRAAFSSPGDIGSC